MAAGSGWSPPTQDQPPRVAIGSATAPCAGAVVAGQLFNALG